MDLNDAPYKFIIPSCPGCEMVSNRIREQPSPVMVKDLYAYFENGERRHSPEYMTHKAVNTHLTHLKRSGYLKRAYDDEKKGVVLSIYEAKIYLDMYRRGIRFKDECENTDFEEDMKFISGSFQQADKIILDRARKCVCGKLYKPKIDVIEPINAGKQVILLFSFKCPDCGHERSFSLIVYKP